MARTILPRWRGFNLLELFRSVGLEEHRSGDFREDDFRWIADWGFNFVRIPMNYHLWTADDDVYQIKEATLEKIDRVVQLGERYGIHISLNLHTAPGYCVLLNRPEPFNLWKDDAALQAFCFHWALFARRYRGIPSDRLSFNLVNEPPAPAEAAVADRERYPLGGNPPDPQRPVWNMTRADHERVIRAVTATIREIDPDRLIIADGVQKGALPSPELADLGIAQSCRAYRPAGVTFYNSFIPGSERWPAPTWPQPAGHPGGACDRNTLEAFYDPWADLASQGGGVHCGEGGAFHNTPHDVALGWLRDVLEILTARNIGLALWMFRGPYGILDSNRQDVDYEDWRGHKLDRKLLTLLQRY